MEKKGRCQLCGKNHLLKRCPDFRWMLKTERRETAIQLKVCLNCLSDWHQRRKCTSATRCQVCDLESIIYWRDVKTVLIAGLITLLAISWLSVISIFASLLLALLTGAIAFRIYKWVGQAIQKTSDEPLPNECLTIDLSLHQVQIQNTAGVVVAYLNDVTAKLVRLLLVEDLIDSIQFGVLLVIMIYIGAHLNGMTLVALSFICLFTIPKVYESNKPSIDTYLDLVRGTTAAFLNEIQSAIPRDYKKPTADVTNLD